MSRVALGLCTVATHPCCVSQHQRCAVQAFWGHLLWTERTGPRKGPMVVKSGNALRRVVNLKTAKALGLTIPPSLLLRADQVIE